MNHRLTPHVPRPVLRHALRLLALAAALAAALPATATDYVWTTGGIADDGRPAAITINDTLRIGCVAGTPAAPPMPTTTS